jgi:protein-S-isoprenylcysteine O-methyltransferase Ste14
MSEGKQRDRWLQDVRDRQNNIVFPQTLANETRLWRNIGTRPATALTWAGLAILGLFVFGFIVVLLVMFIREGGWVLALAIPLATLLIFGPIIGLIVWATRRNLRNLEEVRHRSKKATH